MRLRLGSALAAGRSSNPDGVSGLAEAGCQSAGEPVSLAHSEENKPPARPLLLGPDPVTARRAEQSRARRGALTPPRFTGTTDSCRPVLPVCAKHNNFTRSLKKKLPAQSFSFTLEADKHLWPLELLELFYGVKPAQFKCVTPAAHQWFCLFVCLFTALKKTMLRNGGSGLWCETFPV